MALPEAAGGLTVIPQKLAHRFVPVPKGSKQHLHVISRLYFLCIQQSQARNSQVPLKA